MAAEQKWDKQEYLYRMFSNRTRGKEKENYIVNAIWARLDDLRVKPVTQQYVHCKDRYYLLDLYFPQINFGIECDEAHHKNQQKEDQLREIDVARALAARDEKFEMEHIDATVSVEELHRHIEQVVCKIKLRVLEQGDKFKPWNSPNDDWTEIREKGRLCVSDGFSFRTIGEICWRCFGKAEDYAIQRSFFRADDKRILWCPKLAVEADGNLYAQSRGWVNILSEKWDKITEYNERFDRSDVLSDRERAERITFAKSKDERGEDAYRFVGVFEYKTNDEKGGRVYRRIDDSFDLSDETAKK